MTFLASAATGHSQCGQGGCSTFSLGYTKQHAFEDVKELVEAARNHCWQPLDYLSTVEPIWMVTDGCTTGVSGVVSQGADWWTAKVAAFDLVKLNLAQQNYPVHEIKLLAGIETMLQHADILQEIRFKCVTDPEGLTHLLNQKNLSGRQARWLEKISSFDFEVVYVPSSENVLANALSQIYSNDSPETVRAASEYTYLKVVDDDTSALPQEGPVPVLAGLEAHVMTLCHPPRPESAREFAKQVASHFALCGLWEQKSTAHTIEDNADKNNVLVTNMVTDENNADDVEPPVTSMVTDNVLDIVSTKDWSNGPSKPNGLSVADNQQTPMLVDLMSADGVDIVNEIRHKYGEDSLFKLILENPAQFRNFEVENGLIYLKEQGRKLLCIPRIIIQGCSTQEIIKSEAHSILVHLRASKTLDYLRDHAWWCDMVLDMKAFCETCQTCQRSKPSNQKLYGLLNPLAIPRYPLESIGIDFVGPMPESTNRNGSYDLITVIICLLTSMVQLVLSQMNYNSRQLGELMFEEVYKYHRLPKNIISDRDVLFMSTFGKKLHQLIGTSLQMSNAYHLQMDGTTKCAN